MLTFLPFEPVLFFIALGVAFGAAFIKGVVGFAMPTIFLSALTLFLPPETAIAALIVPAVMTNIQQALRTGLSDAVEATRPFVLFLILLLCFIAVFANLFTYLDTSQIYLLIGLMIAGFSLINLVGWRFVFLNKYRRVSDIVVAMISGFSGGIAGIWGVPITVYLTALETPKALQVRLQGVIYGLCAIVFFLTHIYTGVMGWQMFLVSFLLCFPAIIGMRLGLYIQDKLDQSKFRRLTLIVLIIAGLNLLRQGLAG